MWTAKMLPLPAVLTMLLAAWACSAHNITRILDSHPEFSTFNHYLTETHLAAQINARETITVLAVDNTAMSWLLSTHPSIYTIKNVLSIHVLLDYFGAQKLHDISDGSALAATVFQASGSATGSSGFVNITDARGGKVLFGTEDNNGTLPVHFVKSIKEIPYNVSVIQVSSIIPSEVASAPTPAPAAVNLTGIMSAHGCKVFADTLLAYPDALKAYKQSMVGGLTVFCPLDEPFKAFLPRFKNLTAAGKVSFLEFFGVPSYMSIQWMRSNNGVVATLASDGPKKYHFTIQSAGDDVTLETRSVTATITDTLIDEEPLAVFGIDKVILPKELFKDAPAPTPSPAPAPEPAPAKSKGKKKPHKKPVEAPADSPADAPTGDVADLASDQSAAVAVSVGKSVGLFVGFWMVIFSIL